jgi:uncharacterized protein
MAVSSLQLSLDQPNSAAETAMRQISNHGILSRTPFDPMMNRLVERHIGVSLDAITPDKRVGDIGPRPVLILQGGADERVRARSGEKLYASAQEPKELWYEPSITHIAFYRTMPDAYEQRIVTFLDQYLLGGGF